MEWVVTDDIRGETWRRILEYASHDFAMDEIVRLHGPPEKKQKANYEKQAKQIRVCALQAKEYFDAAASSTLFTSPNHLYYSAISLSMMMMLVRGNGGHSLDRLRQVKENRHHGLDFSLNIGASEAGKGLSLLETGFIRVRDDGHFANWYESLPSACQSYGVITRRSATSPSALQSLEQIGYFTVTPFQEIKGAKWSILEKLRNLPDLHGDLWRYRIPAALARARIVIDAHDAGSTFTFYVHPTFSPVVRDAIVAKFSYEPKEQLRVQTDQLGAVVTVTRLLGDEGRPVTYPSVRETLSHQPICYAEDLDHHEIVDLYIAAFALSMASRYYPDLWISCIESQCKAAKLIESTVAIAMKKLPLLALSLLSPDGITISTLPPPHFR